VVTLTAALLFFTTGGITIETWQYSGEGSAYGTGSAIMAFLNGVVYLGDIVLTCFKYD
jgi:hypothetical protein